MKPFLRFLFNTLSVFSQELLAHEDDDFVKTLQEADSSQDHTCTSSQQVMLSSLYFDTVHKITSVHCVATQEDETDGGESGQKLVCFHHRV